MKTLTKIYAILAVVLMTSAFSFAAQTVNVASYPATGVYWANIYCLPSLTGGTTIGLGNYFQGVVAVPVSVTTSQMFALHGPSLATYKITTDGVNPLLAITSYTGTGTTPACTLNGSWTATCSDGDFFGEYNPATGVYDGEGDPADIDCDGGNGSVVNITWTPTTIVPAGLGTATFTLNVYVQASI